MEIVFQALSILFGYLGAYSPKKRNIFIFYIISVIFSILMFYSVGKTAAILPVATTGIRYFIYIFKDKYKTNYPFYFCLLLHISALFLSTKTAIDLIPSLLVITGCFVYWYLDGAKLKLYVFILNIPWIFYYAFCGLYLSAVNAFVQTVLMIITYFKLKNNTIETPPIKKIKTS